MKRNSQRGFTLIELSIVIIIIGLIVAAIVGGQSVIRQANIRSVISDFSGFQTAVRTFKLQYEALPGDIEEAVAYWPDNSVYPGFTTADGDGDGFIEDNLDREDLRSWQHLHAAEMLGTNLTGVPDGTKITVGTNVPASEVSNAGYWLVYEATPIYGKSGNVIHFGSEESDILTGGVVTTPEAVAIDQKMDDGNADNGKIVSVNAGAGGCVDGLNDQYIKSNVQKTCHMIYWLTE